MEDIIRKRVVIYHGDADGRCAAALAGRHAAANGANQIEYVPVEYGFPLPDLADYGYDSVVDDVWLVDFSFKIDDMIALAKAAGRQRLHWFDHHESSLEELTEMSFLPGLRKVGTAGCMLVWRFIQPKVLPPWPVTYIADRDVWQFNHGDDTRHFYEVFLAEPDSHPESELWDQYFNFFLVNEPGLIDYVSKGKHLWSARRTQLRSAIERLGSPVLVVAAGNDTPHNPKPRQFTCLRCNMMGSGDFGEIVLSMGYDVAWAYVRVPVRGGSWVWKHSLYSNSKIINVGELCRQYGGGGHAGAAGFEESEVHSKYVQFDEFYYRPAGRVGGGASA